MASLNQVKVHAITITFTNHNHTLFLSKGYQDNNKKTNNVRRVGVRKRRGAAGEELQAQGPASHAHQRGDHLLRFSREQAPPARLGEVRWLRGPQPPAVSQEHLR
jgi:hypothetical protein